MKIVDKLKEKVRRNNFRKYVNWYVWALGNETTEQYNSFASNPVEREMHETSQKYAGILIDLLKDYYKKDNQKGFDVINQIIIKYGKKVESTRIRTATRGPRPSVVQLELPKEIQEKIDLLYKKYEQEQNKEYQNFLDEIDSLSK